MEGEKNKFGDGGGALSDRPCDFVLRNEEGSVRERRRWREGDAAEAPRGGPVSMSLIRAVECGMSSMRLDVLRESRVVSSRVEDRPIGVSEVLQSCQVVIVRKDVFEALWSADTLTC